MSTTDHTETAVDGITEACGVTPSEDQAKDMNRITQQAIFDAVLKERSSYATGLMTACSADKDLGHKIADEIRRNEEALIANLSSVR